MRLRKKGLINIEADVFMLYSPISAGGLPEDGGVVDTRWFVTELGARVDP